MCKVSVEPVYIFAAYLISIPETHLFPPNPFAFAFQGHCHPKVMKALVEQAERLTLSSRAFYNDKFPIFAEYLTRMFGYDMMLPMNTGAEGVETALKLARKWGYEKKLIPKDEVVQLNKLEFSFSSSLCFVVGHSYNSHLMSEC